MEKTLFNLHFEMSLSDGRGMNRLLHFCMDKVEMGKTEADPTFIHETTRKLHECLTKCNFEQFDNGNEIPPMNWFVNYFIGQTFWFQPLQIDNPFLFMDQVQVDENLFMRIQVRQIPTECGSDEVK